MTTIKQLEVEEMSEQLHAELLGLLILDEFNRRGWVYDCPNNLLTNAERAKAYEALRHPGGFANFSDDFLESAVMWVVAGIKSQGFHCEIDITRRINELKEG